MDTAMLLVFDIFFLVQNGTVHLENNTGTRDQCMSETKFPYFHGIALLQLSEVDIGCNNDNIGL
jgi:hypothetical protein